MARPRHLRFCAVALWAVCLVGAGVGHAGGAETAPAAGAPTADVSALHPAADPAVLPVRASDELRAATHAAPLRALLVLGVLAGLVGLPASLRRRSASAGEGRRALLARRHAICLRAPPLLRLA